jgi:hypothetical protein
MLHNKLTKDKNLRIAKVGHKHSITIFPIFQFSIVFFIFTIHSLSAQINILPTTVEYHTQEDSIIYVPLGLDVKTFDSIFVSINCTFSNGCWQKFNEGEIILRKRIPDEIFRGPYSDTAQMPDWALEITPVDPQRRDTLPESFHMIKVVAFQGGTVFIGHQYIGVGVPKRQTPIIFATMEDLQDFLGPNGLYVSGNGFHVTANIDTLGLNFWVADQAPNNFTAVPDIMFKNFFTIEHTLSRASFAIFEQHHLVKEFEVEIGIAGGRGIWLGQRSLRIRVIKDSITSKYPRFDLFGTGEPIKLEKFKLRNQGSGHTDGSISDPIANDIMRQIGRGYKAKLYSLYIDGIPWGNYFATEIFNSEWVKENYNLPETDSVVAIKIPLKNPNYIGIPEEWKNFEIMDAFGIGREYMSWTEDFGVIGIVDGGYDYFFGAAHKLLSEEIVTQNLPSEQFKNYFDWASFRDEIITRAFASNNDWEMNARIYSDEKGKFHLKLDDYDSFWPGGYLWNSVKTIDIVVLNVFRIFMRDLSYQEDFLRRAQDMYNTCLSSANISEIFEKRFREMEQDYNFHYLSWLHPFSQYNNGPPHPTIWQFFRMDPLRNQILIGTDLARNALLQMYPDSVQIETADKNYFFFNLDEIDEDCPNRGSLSINTLLGIDSSWGGYYYPYPSVNVSYTPPVGYRFIEWEGFNYAAEFSLLNSHSGDSLILTPILELIQQSAELEEIIINEIYALDSVSSDWIELYNPTDSEVSLHNSSISDRDIPKFIFNEDVAIPPLGYLVIELDGDSIPFQLNGTDGETIKLFNVCNEVIDSVAFGPQVHGISYGKCENEFAFIPPTPRAQNCEIVSVLESSNLIQIYPNPSQGIFTIDGLDIESVIIFDILGKTIQFTQRDNVVEINNPVPGIYFIVGSWGTKNIIIQPVVHLNLSL